MGQVNIEKKSKAEYKKGIFFAVLSMVIWGVLPIYWQTLRPINSYVIILYRIVLVGIVSFAAVWKVNGLQAIKELFSDKNTVIKLFVAGFIISLNWSIYIWAVNADHVVQTCIGYYIEPLMICLFGMIFFKEKLNPYKTVALIMALIGVAILLFHFHQVPLIALGLAVTFAAYAAIKKSLKLPPLISLFFETVFLVPFALAGIFIMEFSGNGAVTVGSPLKFGLLLLCGIFTAVPLGLFSAANNRIPMITLGIIQYLSPSIALLIGIFILKEPFDLVQLISFVVVWIGLVFFSYGEIKTGREIEKRE